MYARWVNLLVFFSVSVYASALDNDECEISRKNLPQQKLREHLFCDYRGYDLRPVKDTKIATNVSMTLLMKYFTYVSSTATLTVDSWLALYWTDEYLKWDPNEFDGITQIHLSDFEMWVPDLALKNQAGQTSEAQIIDRVKCALSSNGLVSCVPSARHTALCVPDLSKFPYDTQNCTLKFSSLLHNDEELNLEFANPAFLLEDMQPNGNWKLESVTAQKNTWELKCCPNKTYSSLEYFFLIKRISANHASTMMIPSIVLFIMTLTSVWIPSTQQERLNLCFVNLVTHFLHMQYVSWMVPTHGAKTPYLVSFSRDSMLLCSLTIILTVILKNLIRGSLHAPSWVSTVVSFLTDCRVGEIILLNDYSIKGVASLKGEEDGANIINNSNNIPNENQDWLIFAKILDRLCFIIYFFLYAIMFLSFIP